MVRELHSPVQCNWVAGTSGGWLTAAFLGVASGVPSREAQDELLESLPAYFEADRIHIAALVTASYSGEEYSHYLATSSLGTWLKEQGVPAIYGVDTRALAKKIREQGSMLGKLLIQKPQAGKKVQEEKPAAATNLESDDAPVGDWREDFDDVEWTDPNKTNIVAEGNSNQFPSAWDFVLNQSSVRTESTAILTAGEHCAQTAGWKDCPRAVRGCRYEVQPAQVLPEPWSRG